MRAIGRWGRRLRGLGPGRARLDGHDEALARLGAELEEARGRVRALEEASGQVRALEGRLDEAAAKLAHLHPDDVGRAQSTAEDALARADNAQRLADDALERAARARAMGEEEAAGAVARSEDALARAGDARSLADLALQRAAAARAHVDDATAAARAHAEDATAAARAHAEDAAAATRAHAEDAAAATRAHADDAAATAGLALDAAREALLPGRVAAFTSWLELCPPPEERLVSVVLPTRDRPALLPRAVASVLEQLYGHWELLVVDDGETGSVDDVLAYVEDERVVAVEGPRRGLGAARNAGLARATGDLVCYLDDDNVMHPRWLQAVAHVLSARDDVDVVYGVTLAEHRLPDTLADDGWWPGLWQLPWSRGTLLEQNVTDAGALAHRADLPAASFDERLATGEDWDLLIRLTADRPALAVPAVSHAYAMAADDRMSDDPDHPISLDEIRRRHARRG